MPVDDLVENASLITVAVGLSDVANRARSLAMDYNTEVADIAEELIKRMWEGYNNWLVQYPQLLDYLSENTDATVVIVGAMNPVYGITLSDDYAIPVGSALSVITTLMNEQYAAWAEEYGFIYVDIFNVETGTTESDENLTFSEFLSSDTRSQGIATHPTENGQKQIARLILNALEEDYSNQKSNINNIVVDLGRFDSVSEVYVDGNKVYNYYVEDSTLYIPMSVPTASILTVTVERSNGSTALTTYQLSYNQGYTAYRLYTTNNIAGVTESITKAAKKITSKIADLFKR